MSQKKSRVKKFEEFRQSLLDEQTDAKVLTKELTPFANQLHQIDNDHFENVKQNYDEDYHSPLHMRNERYSLKKEVEVLSEIPFDKETKSVVSESTIDETPINETDSFNNQYLEEFIKEVKDYNVSKGYRSEQDTKSNLLNEVKSNTVLRPFGDLEPSRPIEEYVEEYIDEEIIETPAPEIKESNPTSEQTLIFEAIKEEKSDDSEVDQTIMMKVQEYADSEETYENYVTDNHDTLLEETTKLKTQLNEQNSVVTEMSGKIDKTNRILNILITILVILIVISIVVIGYNILKLNRVI